MATGKKTRRQRVREKRAFGMNRAQRAWRRRLASDRRFEGLSYPSVMGIKSVEVLGNREPNRYAFESRSGDLYGGYGPYPGGPEEATPAEVADWRITQQVREYETEREAMG